LLTRLRSRIKIIERKKILITAGPTWVPIDKVRVISNIASGETGILLAKEADRLGLDVTLILGPIGSRFKKTIGVKRFHHFDELHGLIKRELKNKNMI
jgi:phosphopantothenoylcysteine decarboxylase/phosphopantothenate--cysteine ligase